MSPLWEPNPAYGTPVPDITKIIEPPAIVLHDITDQAPIAYSHIQMIPDDEWIIHHNLNFHPKVTVVDSAGTIVEGEIRYNNRNTMTLNFASAFSGNAYLS